MENLFNLTDDVFILHAVQEMDLDTLLAIQHSIQLEINSNYKYLHHLHSLWTFAKTARSTRLLNEYYDRIILLRMEIQKQELLYDRINHEFI